MTGLVLGGGVAGLLAASVVADRFGAVTLVERDRFAARRPGVPQARHAHLFLGSGARAVDELVPGTVQAVLARGGRRIGMPEGILTYTPQGWMPRFPQVQFLLSATRGLVEEVLRERVLADERITAVEGGEVVGLDGDRGRVTGARIRDRDTRRERSIAAELVLDATGSSSKITRWLGELGLSVPEEVVDGGVGYATREFRPPATLAREFPAVFVQPDPLGSGRAGVVLPIEGEKWIVSLMGMRGSPPPSSAPDFLDFARALRHPVIGRLIATAEPLGPVHGFRAGPNRWRRFDRMPSWPEGLVVLGDSACTFNPLYGHGMSVAAFGARVLRDHLRRHGSGPGLARGVQRAVARAAADAWALAVGQDIRYEHTIGPRPNLADRLRSRYAERVGRAAAVDPAVTAKLLASYTLDAPLSKLLRPRTAFAVLSPSYGRPADSPPLTARELRLLEESSTDPGGRREQAETG
ncbi:MAG TPA: enterotoxin [Amycolatopsis sp.]|nr:enterotoxin [Amycolatopsis sp.]